MSSSTEKVKFYLCCGVEIVQHNNVLDISYQCKYGVKLPVNITLRQLNYIAMQKCGIEHSTTCNLVFQYDDGTTVKLGCDEDTIGFLQFAANQATPPLLYVVSESTPQFHYDDSVFDDDDEDEVVPETQEQQEQQQQQQQQQQEVNDNEGRFAGVSDDETHVFTMGISEEEEEVNDNESRFAGVSDNDENEGQQEYTRSNKSFSELNDYFDMPPPLPTPESSTQTYQGVPYHRTPRIYIEQLFYTKEEMTTQLGIKFMEEGFEMKTKRSDRCRYTAVCGRENCDWKMSAIATGPKGGMFVVKKLNDVHTCSRTQLHPNHRQATKKTLGHMLKQKFKDSRRAYPPKDIMNDVNQRYGITIGYHQAWRARCNALLSVRGTPEESYERLPFYLYNLERNNPGTVTRIHTDSSGRFELCFAALGPAIRTFVTNLRRVLVIDAAHLKGRYKGMMFLAVAMDGNNNIVPVAFGVGKSETTDEWTWFMSMVRECIGDLVGLVFMSDRAPSISNAIANIYPNAPHAICCRHLEMNCKTKDKRITTHNSLYWKACKAYTVGQFDRYMNALRHSCDRAADVMFRAGVERWSVAHFPAQRYDIVTSNSAESVNALSRFARRLPIVSLMEYFRSFQQEWYHIRRQKGAEMRNLLTPKAEEIIQQRARIASTWSVYAIGSGKFQVQDNRLDAIVDMNDRVCSCFQWQKSGLPCGHAIVAAIKMGSRDCSNLALSFYYADTYRQTYQEEIYPAGPPESWESPAVPLHPCNPPLNTKNSVGRPRNNDRRRSQGEDPIQRRCTRCQAVGHSTRECQTPAPSSVPRNRRYSGQTSNTQGPSELEPHGTLSSDSVDYNFNFQ